MKTDMFLHVKEDQKLKNIKRRLQKQEKVLKNLMNKELNIVQQ